MAVLAAAAPAEAARQIPGRGIEGAQMHGRVHDAVLAPRAVQARASAAVTKVFQDGRGNSIRISTDVPGLDLTPYAQLLAGIPLHGREIQDLAVQVVPTSKIGAMCGSQDALACYGREGPGSSAGGLMLIPVSDRDLAHIVVHEYGHHMDRQNRNLAGLGYGCGADGDGSRRWFFARDVKDNIVNHGWDCNPETDWEHLLPELYAEDFSRANGVGGWVLPLPPPSRKQIDALRDDIVRPFRTRSTSSRVSVPRRREFKRRVTVTDWMSIDLRLTVPKRRDYDLFVYAPGARRPLFKSTRSGSADERIRPAFIAPGTYTVVARSHGRGGGARLKLALR